MLQAMLLAGIVAAPLGSAALFLPARRYAQNAGTWPALRRLVLAVIGTVMLAMAVAVILRVLGASSHNLSAGVAGVVFASLPHLVVKMDDHDLWMAFFEDPAGHTLALMQEAPKGYVPPPV